MTTILISFIISFLVAAGAVRVLIDVALRHGYVDVPDDYRKKHKRPIPWLGGPGVYIGFLAPIIGVLLFPQLTLVSGVFSECEICIYALLSGAALILLLGLLDDMFDLRPIWRILAEVFVACLMFALGIRIETIASPFGGSLALGIFALPVTVFWFVACMNAVNLLDGIDGLAAGTSVFVGLTLFLVSLFSHNVAGMFLAISFSGATLGFLVFNFPPASIFLGNSGSMLLGFLIASLSLVGATMKAGAAITLFVPVVALGLPVMDTFLAIVRRWYHKLPISSPDRGHIHHVLVSMGYSPRKAVTLLYGISILLAGAALALTIRRNEVIILVIASLVIMASIFARLFSSVRVTDVMSRLLEDRSQRKRSGASRVVAARVISQMSGVTDMDVLWELCGNVFDELNLMCAELNLDVADDTGSKVLVWGSGEAVISSSHRDGWVAEFGVHVVGQRVGILKVEKKMSDVLIAGYALDLLDHLRTALGCAIERIEDE
ncbi:MAG: undecaprenyl/decaprenyl-phosphate alpha-N-acetylglucosaminyl 1-phosphate transferase [Kiritimatiellae bacterium]|nr:undecaprenyl/decaprenyl-phosphate alpha-N-acetylglucosaminyl 1-phosphate transferase [Kiritimatiellia bacterium]